MLFRSLSLFALLLISVTTASAQDACTVDSGIHIGSPACPYQWVGATTATFTGDGNGLGFIGMTSQCRGEFGPGARMCTSKEILESDTHNLLAIPADGCWLRPVFQPFQKSTSSPEALDISGRVANPTSHNCGQWEENVGAGLTLQSNGTIDVEPCSVPRSVACCKPTAVPAPTSSLSVPMGAVWLAALSIMKGGA
jgi:hypothetical protein